MPIYEYKCLECGNKFEKLVNNNSQEIICEKCYSDKVKKLISKSNLGVNLGSGDNQQSENTSVTIKQPIIKDRNSGRTLFGPEV